MIIQESSAYGQVAGGVAAPDDLVETSEAERRRLSERIYDCQLLTSPVAADVAPTTEVTGAIEPSLGEQFSVVERIIVAPATGVFQPRPLKPFSTEGEIVYRGEVIGTVASCGREEPVESMFTGLFMGLLAAPTERVREGQPIAWLRRFDG